MMDEWMNRWMDGWMDEWMDGIVSIDIRIYYMCMYMH